MRKSLRQSHELVALIHGGHSSREIDLRQTSIRRWVALLGIASLPGCGPGGAEGSAAREAESARVATPSDPRLADAAAALEAGLPDAARTLLEKLEGASDPEVHLLRARAALAEGDGVEALRQVGDARSLAPRDPEVAAVEIELLAVLGRAESAAEKLREAQKTLGRTGALERARGVLLLRTPGRGREAVEALERARELDPDLAFVDFPLAQAHLLAGRACLGESMAEEALKHARAARAYDAANPDYRELEAEALCELLEFEAALLIYDELQAEGRELGATRALLHQRLATRLLVEKRREGALEHYLAARELGSSDEELGFGTVLLAEAASEALERGLEAYEEEEFEAAEGAFEHALRLDPSCLEAKNHLGSVRFQRADYRGAAELWQQVLACSTERSLEPQGPVHLNLARAWKLAGETERARAVLAEYLERSPEGGFSEETRDLLGRLDEDPPTDSIRN